MSESTKSTRRAKNKYRTADGQEVPGVTTVLGMRGKPEALVEWAFRMGREHPTLHRLSDYVDDLATIGSAAHDMLDAQIKGYRVDLTDYTPNEVAAGANSVRKYEQWAKGRQLVSLASDLPMVSEQWRFGGKLDWYVGIDEVPTVVDFKSGARIYRGHLVQSIAYAKLLRETIERGKVALPLPQAVGVLQVGRTSREGFSDRFLPESEWEPYWQWFLALLRVYECEKEFKGDDR